ncbi:AmpG family muropeptide MFS transporter [Blastomonas sp.]|uniref:AmpG family muropeptide MFS transporter n=1 Tax=Blastomonas TaxID=150203 RepID=UPI00258C6925|nr:MFS transporter [Blastomonas sp.]
MTEHATGVAPEVTGWRASLPVGLRPYTEAAPLAALFLGMSSGFPFAMIAATLSTRLAQSGIEKSTVTAFALTFLAYNFKWLWAPIIDVVKLPLLGRIGQRVSWLILCAVLVMVSIIYLGILDPEADIGKVAVAAILVGVAGATFDIVIDAYRIELLEPHQLGVGSGMSQYGWRIGAALAGSLALVIAARADWTTAYIAVSFFGLFAVITGLVMGEPARRQDPKPLKGPVAAAIAYVSPLAEFFKRSGALIVLLFVLVHKIGDTLATLTLRLLFEDLGYTNDEVAIYDVGLGFWALLAGIFVGGFLYAKLGMKRSVLISLILMAVSNLAFAGLASAGHNNWAMAGAVGFENFASGIGGVCVVAYLSALCNLEFTATQFALLSAAASITGRFLTGTLAGGMIEQLGFANFYLVTTLAALPGVLLFWWMMASGLVDRSLGTAGTEESGE